MNWDDLCGINTEDGKAIDMNTILHVDHNKRGKTGMPVGNVLVDMMTKADNLGLEATPKTTRYGLADGIAFHIAQYVPGGKALTIKSKFVGEKRGSAVCFENALYDDTLIAQINGIQGNIIIHQGMAPCKRCRAGYKKLAQNGMRTIVISSDTGYDNAPKDTVFLFSPTGLVFYRQKK